jgi:WD40 repeat protein
MSPTAVREWASMSRHLLRSRRAFLVLALLPILTATWFLSGWEKPETWKVAFSPDGTLFATLASTPRTGIGRLTVRRFQTYESVLEITQPKRTTDFAFSPDGTTIATLGNDGSVCLWEVATGVHLATWKSQLRTGLSLQFVGQGELLAVNGGDELQLWDVAGPRLLDRLSARDWLAGGLAVAPNGPTLAIEVYGKGKPPLVDLYDVSSEKLVHLRSLPNSGGQLGFSPDGALLAANRMGRVTLWDLATQPPKATLIPGSFGIAFAPDGKTVANIAIAPAAITLVDLSTQQVIRTIATYEGMIWSPRFSPDGRTLAAGNIERGAFLYDVATGRQLAVFPKPQLVPLIYWALAAVLLAFLLWGVAWVRSGVRRRRRWQPLVDVALLNAIVLAGLMARVLRIGFADELGRPVLLFAVAQVAALLSLLIAWMVFGGGRWSLRLPAALVGLAAVATIPLVVWGASDWRVWEMCIGAVSLLGSLFVVLNLCRFFGMRIVPLNGDAAQEQPAMPRCAQFPLKDLVLTTGAAAVLFAVARLASPTSLPTEIVAFIAIEGACLASVAAMATWAALGMARLPIRVAALGITAAAVGSVHEVFFKTAIPLDLPWWWLASIPALASFFVAASLWIVRAHGYRMMFHRRATRTSSEPSCSQPYASSPSLGHPLTR